MFGNLWRKLKDFLMDVKRELGICRIILLSFFSFAV